jgi:hypothetical protein
LFWGLPVALLVSVWTARAGMSNTFAGLPPVISAGWLLYALWQIGGFQKQERVWRAAVERARVLAFINLGLSPFLYWYNRVPSNVFFFCVVLALAGCGLVFLASLNLVVRRLCAMLPDEALRVETRQFTAFNLNLLLSMVVLGTAYLVFRQLHFGDQIPPWLTLITFVVDRISIFMLIPLLLLPLAMTMAMLWKTKQVILDSVFSAKV